jgi:hypothetical protein
VTGPAPTQVDQMIRRLEQRAYKTYLCRLHAFRRLSHAETAWNTALIAFSTSTTIASVGILVDREMYGRGGDAMLLALAILSLVASLVVSSVQYGTRAKAMEANYKQIQQISVSAENLLDRPGADREERYTDLLSIYEAAVTSSENHTARDYRIMQTGLPGSSVKPRLRDTIVTLVPYSTLCVPIALLAPFTAWFISGLQ